MGLVVVPGGSGGISVNVPEPFTKTIFHNCCSREYTADRRSATCYYRLYFATVLLYNILPDEGLDPGTGTGPAGNVIVTFALLGEPIQLDCFSGPLVLVPGDNITLAVAITFDQILLTFLPPPPPIDLAARTEMLYRISLGMCPA